jgi:hypothetical protein
MISSSLDLVGVNCVLDMKYLMTSLVSNDGNENMSSLVAPLRWIMYSAPVNEYCLLILAELIVYR